MFKYTHFMSSLVLVSLASLSACSCAEKQVQELNSDLHEAGNMPGNAIKRADQAAKKAADQAEKNLNDAGNPE